MKTFLKILAGLMVLGILGVAGCAALVGGAADQAAKDSQSADQSAAKFRAEFKHIKVGDSLTGHGGMTIAQVRALVGRPDKGDVSKTRTGGTTIVTYTYHFFLATGAPAWVVGFTNGRVTDKSSL